MSTQDDLDLMDRRAGDRLMQQRLDQMEKDHHSIRESVGSTATSMKLMQMETLHLKELMSARLDTLEGSHRLHISLLEQLRTDITRMASEPEGTPASRNLKAMIGAVQAGVDENSDRIDAHKEFQDRVDGVLSVVKWLGPLGLLGLLTLFVKWFVTGH